MDIMDSILDLDFDKLTQPEQTAFMEGIQYADAVLLSYDMFTLEAVEMNNNSLVGKVKSIARADAPLKNTRKTIKDTASIYNRLTDLGASVLKLAWDLVMKLIRLMNKLLSFITKFINNIPSHLNAIGRGLTSIPRHIKNAITGDVELYITYQDVQTVMDRIIPSFDAYMQYLEKLTQGDAWRTGFRRRLPIFKDSDIVLAKKANNEWNKISAIKFTPTQVKFSDEVTREAYFGPAAIIKTKNGNVTYYDALNEICMHVKSYNQIFNTIHRDLKSKIDRTEANHEMDKLNGDEVALINRTLSTIGKSISFTSKIVNYIMSDTNKIESAIKKYNKGAK